MTIVLTGLYRFIEKLCMLEKNLGQKPNSVPKEEKTRLSSSKKLIGFCFLDSDKIVFSCKEDC